eukprot:11207891-Alexandrium_andersonii.AAC.1
MDIAVPGCQLGYRDRESGLPHAKPVKIITSSEAVVNSLAQLKCNCSKHQPLEGSNAFGSRTRQAAAWPAKFDKLVLKSIFQQAEADGPNQKFE